MKRKFYLVDTENVGDRWYDLLGKIDKKGRVIAFYTENHSKDMEKYLVKHIHNPRILWLACAAGNNALDYQLIGVLSYLVARHPEAFFCICSNDRDYQGTVDFWLDRGVAVCQKGYAAEIKKKAKKKKKKKGKKSQASAAVPTEISARGGVSEEHYVEAIARAIPMSDLHGWYIALVTILGQERGRGWYMRIKEDNGLCAVLSQYCTEEAPRVREVRLAEAVLERQGLDPSRAEDACRIIHAHKPGKLGAIKNDFDKCFGAKLAQQYYRALRPVAGVIKKMG